MGMDFTPHQIHLVSLEHPDLYLSNIEWHMPDGSVHNMYTSEEQELRYRYQIFATLFTDLFLKFSSDLEEDERDKILSMINKTMEEFVKDDDENNDLSKYPEELKLWYYGKLDPSFYYHETNDRLFYEWLIKNKNNFRNSVPKME